MKELSPWAGVVIFGEQVSTVLLVYSVGTVWIWATGAVDLDNP